MARPRYRITEDDAWFAYEWLKKMIPSDRLSQWMQRWVDANQEDKPNVADELTALAESWLDSVQWTRMKNAIRRRKANIGADMVSTRLPADVVAMLNQIVELDEVCHTQADALQKYLPPIRNALREAKNEQLKAYWTKEYQSWTLLELAALSLKLVKWGTLYGRGLEIKLGSIHITKKNLINALAAIPLVKENDVLTEFQAEKGKWIGLAKRKWQELKQMVD